MFLSILFFKRALKAFTRALQVTVNVTSVLQTQRLILEKQVAYAMKGSTRNLDYMELLAKVIAAPEFYNFLYYSDWPKYPSSFFITKKKKRKRKNNQPALKRLITKIITEILFKGIV